MSIVIRITNPELVDGVSHEESHFQVATDKLMHNKVAESYETESLLSKTFSIPLDPSVKYYSRTRLRLSTGWTIWSAVTEFVPTDINQLDINPKVPSIITPPTITTDSDMTSHTPMWFNINLSEFVSDKDIKHVATSIVIEDMFGNVKYLREYDKVNLTTVLIDDVILDSGTAYVIKACYHASNDCVSELSSYVIVTATGNEVSFFKPLTNIDFSEDFETTLEKIDGLTKTMTTIYSYDDNSIKEVYNNVNIVADTLHNITIPANTLKDKKLYLLKLTLSTINKPDQIVYIKFTTYTN